jgi:thiol-disulfide isomerase/thioredoxin
MKKRFETKTIVLAAVILLVIAAIYFLERDKPKIGTNMQDDSTPAQNMGKYQRAPELKGIMGYINTDQNITLASLRGQVVIIDFWTYSCVNCLRTLPYLNAWYEKYRDDGLVIVGVHTPEFNFEKDYENVKDAVNRYDIKFPVVLDNGYSTWSAYQNNYWPRKYLIDRNGYIRYDHIGEGAYEETEKQIQELLSEKSSNSMMDAGYVDIVEQTPTTRNTQELYAGYETAIPRGQNIGNSGGLQESRSVDYIMPESIRDNLIYLEGHWMSNPEDIEATGESSSIHLKFKAKSANIVGSSDMDSRLYVYIDGEYIEGSVAGDDVVFDNGKAFIVINEPRLYNIFRGEYSTHTLKLTAEDSGFKFNAFTFG